MLAGAVVRPPLSYFSRNTTKSLQIRPLVLLRSLWALCGHLDHLADISPSPAALLSALPVHYGPVRMQVGTFCIAHRMSQTNCRLLGGAAFAAPRDGLVLKVDVLVGFSNLKYALRAEKECYRLVLL